MLPLAFLLLGLLCATISRIMLFIAAINVSIGWSLGVWLPFGPLCFRRTFPDLSRTSAPFRNLTILCFGLYLLLLGFGSGPDSDKRESQGSVPPQPSNQATGYAMEPAEASGTKNMEERRASNVKELDRLAKWNDTLRLKKRDLLRSDIQGNRTYEAEFGLYTEALAKATLEKDSLAPATQQKDAPATPAP